MHRSTDTDSTLRKSIPYALQSTGKQKSHVNFSTQDFNVISATITPLLTQT